MAELTREKMAGFWLRFVAFIIDVIVVALIVFPFALIIGLIAPNYLLVEVPFGLFTTTTTISEATDNQPKIEKDEVLGLWTNYYKLKEIAVKEGDVEFKGEVTFNRVLIEPEMKNEISKTTSSTLESYVIFIYWIFLEASIWQASLGKRIMGLKVVTESGEKPTLLQCANRNLLKVLSGIILFIGFFMAGWTDKKQALHDKIPSLLVIKSP